MKKKLVLVIIVAIVGIILFLENVCKISVFDSVKQITARQSQMTNNEENSKNDDITIVNVTNLEIGSNLNHKHILKTAYNSTQHWNECTICYEKQDIVNHEIKTKWKLGYESCEENNGYTDICVCGYKKSGHKPCVWDGKSLESHGGFIHLDENEEYVFEEYACTHTRKCIVCGNHIFYSYYMNKYGVGDLYYVTLGKNGNYAERCKSENGRNLTCNNMGTCSGCGTIMKTAHSSYRIGLDNKLMLCGSCNLKVRNNNI